MTDPVLDALRAALAARPQDTALRLAAARRLLDAGDLPGAMAEAATALQHDPGCDEARDFMLSAVSAPRPEPATPAGSALAAEPTAPAAEPPAPAAPSQDEPAASGSAADSGAGPGPGDFDWAAAENQVGDVVGPRFVTPARAEPEMADPGPHSAGEAQDAFETERPALRLADVGGMEAVKDRLEVAFLAPMRNPELRRLYGKSLRGGLLLYGPPGCGKTFLARAVAGEMGAHFIVAGIAEILDMYLGKSEQNLHQLFQQARRNAPCVLFLDEVDALGAKRSQLRGSATDKRIVNQLLTELDSVGSDNDGVFVLGATNQPWDVDTALRRPGRFDRTVLVLPPDAPARAAILEYHVRERPVERIDLAGLAEATDRFSGADLAHLCETAAEKALIASARSGTARLIGMPDFAAALREVRPSTGPWFSSARGVAMFANEGGAYDDLAAYFRDHPDA
jgi:AAA+ superfamily predicted ATPase